MIARVERLRFPLVALVVFIHSYHPSFVYMTWAPRYIWEFISYGLASVAVPTFFLISGYLFFYETDWSKQLYCRKLVSRLSTLFVPYLVWTAVSLAYTLLLFHSPTYPAQMWFITDLLLLAIISPLFHFMHQKAPVLFLLLFLMAWLFLTWGSLTSILFFYLGSLLAVKKLSLFVGDKYGLAATAVGLVLMALNIKLTNFILHNVGVAFSVIGVLWLSRLDFKFLHLEKLAKSSFFVFCVHQPIMGIAIAWIYWILNITNDIQRLALYLLSPIIIIGLCLSLYWVLQQLYPKGLAYITGNRL